MNRPKLSLLRLLAILGSVVWTSPVLAAEGGYSNYIPGTYGDFAVAVAPDPGPLLRNDVYYYSADESRAVLQGRARADVDVSFKMNFLTGFYTTDLEVLGGKYGFGALVPIVHTDISANAFVNGAKAAGIRDDRTGLGDITFFPWSIFWNFGNVHLNFAEYIFAPTADYDEDRLANTGLNYWTFDTNVAMTYLDPERGHEFSFNLGHMYNTKNNDTDYKTGQQVHLDVMVNQFLSETLAVGIHGFYVDQITGDSGNGAIFGDFKSEAAGIGPALLWTPEILGKDVPIIVKWLHEVHAENRLEGDHVLASFVLSF